jgi:hypothetical protein
VASTESAQRRCSAGELAFGMVSVPKTGRRVAAADALLPTALPDEALADAQPAATAAMVATSGAKR